MAAQAPSTAAAKLVPANTDIVFGVHYTTIGTAMTDKPLLGFTLAKEPPQHIVFTRPVAHQKFLIPPGAANYEVKASYLFPEDGLLVGMMPHMHLRGKDFMIRARYPEIFARCPRWLQRDEERERLGPDLGGLRPPFRWRWDDRSLRSKRSATRPQPAF